jgi:hypothetical protein
MHERANHIQSTLMAFVYASSRLFTLSLSLSLSLWHSPSSYRLALSPSAPHLRHARSVCICFCCTFLVASLPPPPFPSLSHSSSVRVGFWALFSHWFVDGNRFFLLLLLRPSSSPSAPPPPVSVTSSRPGTYTLCRRFSCFVCTSGPFGRLRLVARHFS